MEAPRVARGAAYTGIMNVGDTLIAFGFYLAIARILNLADVGRVSMIFFISAAFSTFTLLALNSAVTKHVAEFIGARDPLTASAVAKKAFQLELALSIPCFVIMAALSSWMSNAIFDNSLNAVVLVASLLGALLLNLMNYFGALMYGLGMFGEAAARNMIFYALSRFFALALVFLHMGVLGVAIGIVFGSLAAIAYSIVGLRGRLVEPRTSFPSRRLLSFSLPLYASNILSLGQAWLDVLLLYVFTGSSTTIGIYYLIVGGVTVLSIVSSTVTSTLYPAMSHRFGEVGVEGIRGHISSGFRILTVTIVPLSVALAAVAPTALRLAYGSRYSEAAPAFAILVLFAIFAAYWDMLSTVLQVLGKTLNVLFIALLGLITSASIIIGTAKELGSVSGALGRASMGIVMVILAILILRKSSLSLLVGRELGAKVLLLSVVVGFPLFALDRMLREGNLQPLMTGLIDFTVLLLTGFMGLRLLKPFNNGDITLLEAILPSRLKALVRLLS